VKSVERDLSSRMRRIARSADGLFLVVVVLGVSALVVISIVTYILGDLGGAMLFLALAIMATPFATLAGARAVVPLWRLASRRAVLRDQIERLRHTLDLPSVYRTPPPPDSGISPVSSGGGAWRRGVDPFTARR
jgi:hypothetical protein